MALAFPTKKRKNQAKERESEEFRDLSVDHMLTELKTYGMNIKGKGRALIVRLLSEVKRYLKDNTLPESIL